MGAFFLIRNSTQGDRSSDLLGDIFITLNAASYGAYLVTVTPVFRKYHVFTVIKWVFIFGTAVNILYTVAKGLIIEPEIVVAQNEMVKQTLFELNPAIWTSDTWIGIIFLILGATVGTYLLNAYAMSRLDSVTVGMYVFSQPIFVSLVSVLVFGNSLTLAKIGFIALIFIGVFCVTLWEAVSKSRKTTSVR